MDLKRIIGDTLQKHGTPGDIIDEVLSTNYFDIFVQALTSETIDANSNYQRLEYIGDYIGKHIISELIFLEFPNMNEDSLTHMVTYYVSNKVQGEVIAKVTDDTGKHRLLDYIIYDKSIAGNVEQSVKDDIFESFLAAIYFVLNLVQPGLGWVICRNFIFYHFKKILDPIHALGNARNRLKHIFSRFKYKTGIVEVVFNKRELLGTGGGIEYTVTLSESIVGFLTSPYIEKRLKRPFSGYSGEVIARANGQTAASVVKEWAAENALKYLNDQYGINPDWATRVKLEYDLDDLEGQKGVKGNASLKTQLINRLNDNGFSYYEVKELRGFGVQGNITVYQLIGIRQDGSQKLLMNKVGGGNAYDTRISLIKSFVEHGPSF